MPSNLVLTQPDVVMPQGPMQAFDESAERPALLDDGYAQGEDTRFVLTQQARRFFRVARRLTQDDWNTLYTFFVARKGRPFWFYNVRETQPPYSWDPTGQNPIGRYAVVFEGGLSQATELPRGTCQVALREVAY